MRLLCRQENDGAQSGLEFEIDTGGEDPASYLERKFQSHQGRGWTVTRRPDGLVHAFKQYPASNRQKDPNAILRKDRYMWLED